MTVSWPFDRGNQAFVYGESSLAHVLEPGGRDVGREEWTPTSGLVHDPVLLGRVTISQRTSHLQYRYRFCTTFEGGHLRSYICTVAWDCTTLNVIV
jgi:hypothetical protein